MSMYESKKRIKVREILAAQKVLQDHLRAFVSEATVKAALEAARDAE